MIRAVERPGAAPAAEDEGEEIWYGGYGDIVQDESSLSASVLAAAVPDLEIGSWYSLSEFEQKMCDAAEDTEAVWTTITVDNVSIEGPRAISISVPQITAAKNMCLSVINHLRCLGKEEGIWLRVE